MKNKEPAIVVSCSYEVSAAVLWAAITELEQMHQWYFNNLPDFKAEVGFKTEFPVKSEDRLFTHIWEVSEVVEEKKLSCRWTFKEYPGDSYVHFELEPDHEKTKLTVSCEIIEAFPQDIPEFKVESGEAGWKYFLQDSLASYLKDKK